MDLSRKTAGDARGFWYAIIGLKIGCNVKAFVGFEVVPKGREM